MKYGNYNVLYCEVSMTSDTTGIITQETADRVRAAGFGLAHVTFISQSGVIVGVPSTFGLLSNDSPLVYFTGIQVSGTTLHATVNLDTLGVKINHI